MGKLKTKQNILKVQLFLKSESDEIAVKNIIHTEEILSYITQHGDLSRSMPRLGLVSFAKSCFQIVCIYRNHMLHSGYLAAAYVANSK